MTKQQFTATLLSGEFTMNELANINPKIYYVNTEYYKKYHMGKDEECLKFLRENKHLLK
jgi:hypothetical protein